MHMLEVTVAVARRCDRKTCRCQGNHERHCPVCRTLYLYDPAHPSKPCLACERHIEFTAQQERELFVFVSAALYDNLWA